MPPDNGSRSLCVSELPLGTQTDDRKYHALSAEAGGYSGMHSPHGWRASFSTIMAERYQGDATVDKILDAMLAHAKDSGPYNRAEHLDRRKELAQEWADLLLDGFAPAASLVEGPRR